MGRVRKTKKLSKGQLLLAVPLSCLLALTGCTRAFYRQRADDQVAHILTQKDQFADWRIEQYHVYPDPRARFADQTDPDRPPMPEDDPAASKMSPHPQNPGKAGVANIEGRGYLELLDVWDTENRAEAEAESRTTKETGEQPLAPYGGTAASTTALFTKPKPGVRPPYRLKLDQTVELGLINSREYQDARENLYLTALPVSLQRFAFAPQLFAASQAIREWAGSQTTGGPQNNWTVNSNAGATELFSTGALLLTNFANQTIIHLAGAGRGVTSQSEINLDLVQPLLRGGGLAVTLEPLTQAERDLLYEIREFARFRKTFYVAIAGGGGGSITGASFQPVGVIASPTFNPSAGFSSSGLFPGAIPPPPVFGNPGGRVVPGQSGQLGMQTALAAQVSGYQTTLLQAAQMRVDEYHLEKLIGYLKLAKAMQEGGDISQLQVDQFEQQVLIRRTSLLTDQQQYLQSLDQFKLQLGLPVTLPIELDDADFRPLNQQFQRYEDLFRLFDAASNEPAKFGTPELVAKVRGELRRMLTTSALVQGSRFQKEIEARWAVWEKLTADALDKRLANHREERRKLQDKQTDLETKGQALSEQDEQRLNRLNFEIDLGEFEKLLRDYEGQPWKKLADPAQQRRQQQAKFRYVLNAYTLVLAEARNERFRGLHERWPGLRKLCVDGVDLLKSEMDEAQTAVVQHAEANRLDLMNVRAEVTDAWRQLAIFANALMGTLSVQYHVDSTTPSGLANPLAFAGSRSHEELILNTELPLVRIQERNNYRASLINYQRARRVLQRAEDQVAFDVRNEILQLRQLEENYRIQVRQVELAYMTVENALDTFQAPPAPGTVTTPAAAAALTTQLINAQNSLYQAQFAMTTIWITYLNTRLQLYRDMELMPLDSRGVWIDDVATCECPISERPESARLHGQLLSFGQPEPVAALENRGQAAATDSKSPRTPARETRTARQAPDFWSYAHSLLQRHKTPSSAGSSP
jgi:outer membrane protein TolC